MMECRSCGKEFIQIGQRKKCGHCYLDEDKTTFEEKVEEICRWWRRRGVEPWVLFIEDRMKRGYDGTVDMPGVGVVRWCVGKARRKSEMGFGVARKVRGVGELTTNFRCARLGGEEVKVPWGKKGVDYSYLEKEECGCRGCEAKRWVESALPEVPNPTLDGDCNYR